MLSRSASSTRSIRRGRRFRTFLRTCLDGFVANQRQAGQRLKRGGAAAIVSFDALTAEGELRRHGAGRAPGLRRVLRSRVGTQRAGAGRGAISRRGDRRPGATRQSTVFTRYDLEAPDRDEPFTYADLARELGMPVTDVTNALNAARREFRAAVLECLRELTMSDDEFRAEARRLLGVDVGRRGRCAGPAYVDGHDLALRSRRRPPRRPGRPAASGGVALRSTARRWAAAAWASSTARSIGELARDVAVKVLNAPARPGMAARLLREARIIARLEHPGIVPIYDVGHTQEGPTCT